MGNNDSLNVEVNYQFGRQCLVRANLHIIELIRTKNLNLSFGDIGMSTAIESVLVENRVFPPSAAASAGARISSMAPGGHCSLSWDLAH